MQCQWMKFSEPKLLVLLVCLLCTPGCLAPAIICVAGNYSPCQCPDGSSGNRKCKADGTAFENTCDCAPPNNPEPRVVADTSDSDIGGDEDSSATGDAAITDADTPATEDDTVSSDAVSEDVSDTLDTSPPGDIPCNEFPWQCPTGQTCWLGGEPRSDGSWDGTFECLNSRPNGTTGCTCELKIGIPTCSDGLYCLILLGDNTPPSHCTHFCDNSDPDHACPSGYYCGPVTVKSQTLHLCMSETGQVSTKDCSVQP